MPADVMRDAVSLSSPTSLTRSLQDPRSYYGKIGNNATVSSWTFFLIQLLKAQVHIINNYDINNYQPRLVISTSYYVSFKSFQVDYSVLRAIICTAFAVYPGVLQYAIVKRLLSIDFNVLCK